jgi:hypothetical protein
LLQSKTARPTFSPRKAKPHALTSIQSRLGVQAFETLPLWPGDALRHLRLQRMIGNQATVMLAGARGSDRAPNGHVVVQRKRGGELANVPPFKIIEELRKRGYVIHPNKADEIAKALGKGRPTVLR